MGARLSEAFVERAREELRANDLDAWLLYDFHGRNHVAADLLGLPEGQMRRYFVLLAPDASPRALVHRIELSGWHGWPHEIESYVGWEEMEAALGHMLEDRAVVAMEVSPGDGVPYIDNVPAGVVELVESLGVRVVSSVDLISRTAAQWGDTGLDLQRRAAEILAQTARGAFKLAARAAADGEGTGTAGDARAGDAGAGLPANEYELAEWVRATLTDQGLTEVDTIVAVGANAALPHYEPQPDGSAPIRAGEVFLVDLWARAAGEPNAVFADQTWMGYLGSTVPEDIQAAWEALVAARDGGVQLIRDGYPEDLPTGADVDRHVRSILIERGFADGIMHRTGHGIDRELHGVGPTLDSIETRDERRLVPGIGFSVEPGVYYEGRFGLRTEINVYMGDEGPEVSPNVIQHEMWLAE
jgi:Xaa-Pro aminopeptidase